MHTDFVCYVIEEYKNKKGLDGKTVISFFIDHDLIKYIEECYGVLHTVGANYIIDEIDEITAQA
ncbi:MAG: DUF3791 domain-containing protein [Clostridiales bacterium]|jgi:hypothetical protein|nr:DUF3791 domain-containing protein [Clostridiales bacterium]